MKACALPEVMPESEIELLDPAPETTAFDYAMQAAKVGFDCLSLFTDIRVI